jgi:hypothetical protein
MKRFLLATIALGLAVSGFSQTDTTATERVDTIRVGGMIIIKKGDSRDTTRERNITINTRKKKRPTNISTNWFIIDLRLSQIFMIKQIMHLPKHRHLHREVMKICLN